MDEVITILGNSRHQSIKSKILSKNAIDILLLICYGQSLHKLSKLAPCSQVKITLLYIYSFPMLGIFITEIKFRQKYRTFLHKLALNEFLTNSLQVILNNRSFSKQKLFIAVYSKSIRLRQCKEYMAIVYTH
jgi:hypothetical protein